MADTIHLTRKQRLFVNNYVRCLNATEAALASGYGNTYNSAAVAGHQLLKKPKVAAEVARLMAKRVIPENEVVSRLADMATASMEDFIEPSELSGRVEINLDKAHKRGKLHLLKKFKRKPDGSVEIELHDSQAALEKLTRIFGINAPIRVEVDWRIEARQHIAAGRLTRENAPKYFTQDEINELFGTQVAVAGETNDNTPTIQG